MAKGASIKCGTHPEWKMRAKPTSDCDICLAIWDLIRLGAKIVPCRE